MSSPAMLGKGGRSGLARRADKCNRRAVAWAVLVDILRFEQWASVACEKNEIKPGLSQLLGSGNTTIFFSLHSFFMAGPPISDIDILTLLFSLNVTPTQISQIMEQLKRPDAGTFMPKHVYNMNKKTEELHGFAYGLLPDSNDAEKTLSKLERSNINHFYILHNNTGLYACSKGRPSNEEVRIC
jgi:hypothetical protein